MGMSLPANIANLVEKMSSLALTILQVSISAYNNKDEAQTQRIFDDDVTLDKQYKELFKLDGAKLTFKEKFRSKTPRSKKT